MQKSGTKASKSPNPQKVSKAAAAAKKNRKSIGNAKGRSQRSVKSAERRSLGSMAVPGPVMGNAGKTGTRSQRIHSGMARKPVRSNQGGVRK
jgi:hypothetical protein